MIDSENIAYSPLLFGIDLFDLIDYESFSVKPQIAIYSGHPADVQTRRGRLRGCARRAGELARRAQGQ